MSRNCKWWGIGMLAAAGAAVVPVIVSAPEPVPNLPRDVRDLDEALDDCLGTRLDGWDLVDYATGLVNQKFSRYSMWHLWEGSGSAFKNSRGFADQYNLALGRLLAGLGFEVRLVHASRVRFDQPGALIPVWQGGHSWLRVSHAGETRNVCASRADNRAGQVYFEALSPVRPYGPGRGLATRLALVGPVGYQVWRSIITGRPVPRWVYRGFHVQR